MKKALVITLAFFAAPTVTACIIAGITAVQELRHKREMDKLDLSRTFKAQM